MVVLRRSGGVATFFWQGDLPDPASGPFAAGLGQRRFRTIEDAASEEVSVGWVSPGDPTGDSFAAEDLAAGPGAWLRFRIDRKVLPRQWLAIHRDAAQRAKGRKLSARERKELKDDLLDQLLPRVLPTVKLVDALLFRDRRLVQLFGSGRAVREAFAKLFFESFALVLEPADPLQLGLRAGLGAELASALEGAQPVRWPQDREGRRTTQGPAAAATADQEVEA